MYVLKKNYEPIGTAQNIAEAVTIAQTTKVPVQIFDHLTNKLLYEYTQERGLQQFLVD